MKPRPFENLRRDFERVYQTQAHRGKVKACLYTLADYGFIAISVFRFGKYVVRDVRIPILRQLFLVCYVLARTFVEILFGISIDVNSNIGPGFYIGHFGAIVITGELGADCSVGQGVTVGSKGAGLSDGWPVIGDHVYIGAGAKIIGSIRVGNNVRVGANAVVVKDIPDDSLAVGVPARILPLKRNAADRSAPEGVS